MSAIPFEYRAYDAQGREARGTTSAMTRGDAFRQLVAKGLTPTWVQAAGAGSGSRGKRLRAKDLSHFTYQLSVLMSARIPLSEGLRSIAQQEKEGPLREMIQDITRRVESGESFAAAMHEHQHAIGEVYVETVRAAERSGNLTLVLEHLAEMIERTQEMARLVRGALMYPICVSSVLVLATTFLVGFVVPRFAEMFARRGNDLPLMTSVLMNVGQSMQSYWWAYLMGVGSVAWGVWWSRRSSAGRLWWDRLFHRVPYVNRILVNLGVSRFTRVLGLSLSSGLGLVESLTLAGRSSGRAMLMADVDQMVAQVQTGGRLTEVLNRCNYLTLFSKRMLAAGEQSAEIPRMCAVVSRHYDREATDLAKNISTVLEPVMIVVIAGVVLVIALAIFMPMWDMVKMVG